MHKKLLITFLLMQTLNLFGAHGGRPPLHSSLGSPVVSPLRKQLDTIRQGVASGVITGVSIEHFDRIYLICRRAYLCADGSYAFTPALRPAEIHELFEIARLVPGSFGFLF